MISLCSKIFLLVFGAVLVVAGPVLDRAIDLYNFQQVGGTSAGPVYLSTCVYVLVQAFSGWEDQQITVYSGNYIRWGQSRCAIEIATQYTVSYSGATLRATFDNLLADGGFDYSQGERGFATDGSGAYLTFARASWFGNNLNHWYKRGESNDTEAPVIFTYGKINDTETGPVHVWSPSVDLSEQDIFSVTVDTAKRSEAKDQGVKYTRSSLAPRVKAGKVTDLRCGGVSSSAGGDRSWACDCANAAGLVYATAQVHCTTYQSGFTTWQWPNFFSVVDVLNGLVEGALNFDEISFGSTISTGSGNSGGVLFTPPYGTVPFAKAVPTEGGNNCCQEAVKRAQAQLGMNQPPAICTCDIKGRSYEYLYNSGRQQAIGVY